MALTNFAGLSDAQKKVWSRDLWKVARNNSFINKFAGSGSNALVQNIKELTKTEKGDKAVIQLLNDLTNDGVVGDNTLEGNEEALQNRAQTITIDQLRHAVRNHGRMSDQKTVVKFRENGRDQLGYWMSERLDQLAFLTMAGIPYGYTNRGVARTGSNLNQLEFASDVVAPSTNRGMRWDATNGLVATGTALAAADTPSYKMLVEAKAFAKDKYVRGIKSGGGEEVYHVFMSPQGMAALKMDSDYISNVRNAGVRGSKNELFAGTSSVLVDGLWIHEYRHVPQLATTVGDLDGTGMDTTFGTVAGQRVLFCGAQALAMADINDATWDEEKYDYENQTGISTSKIFGLLKPQFHSNIDNGVEDHGIITLDTAI